MNKKKIMVVDTELDGHHVLWLCLAAKVILGCRASVTMLVNRDTEEVVARMGQIDAGLPEKIEIIGSPLSEKTPVAEYFNEIARICQEYGVEQILFNNFDTVASKLCRRAVFGYRPPDGLFGRLAAIYHRPRPLDDGQRGLGVKWKRRGLDKLIDEGLFSHIFLLDPFIVNSAKTKFSEKVDIHHLPDPWLANPDRPSPPPEVKLTDGYKLLQYGIGDKRKGTDLLLNALARIEGPLDITLIVAGKQKNPEIYGKIKRSRHKIILIDRFISTAEEKFLFESVDMVAIPYISHYGSSNILSKAAQYKKPVLASDYHLIGSLVKDNGLGIVFKNNDVGDLEKKLRGLKECRFSDYQDNLRAYSRKCSFANFSNILGKLFD